jgi:hypothetical protein
MNRALALFGALVLASTTTRSSRGCSSRARPSGPGAARNSTRRKLDFGRCECNINSLTPSGTKNGPLSYSRSIRIKKRLTRSVSSRRSDHASAWVHANSPLTDVEFPIHVPQ